MSFCELQDIKKYTRVIKKRNLNAISLLKLHQIYIFETMHLEI